MLIIEYILSILRAALTVLNSASPWIVTSYIIAGLLHDVLPANKFLKHLGTKNLSAIFMTTVSGMFLPICSCGTIPLGISLYYSGAYLGPVLAFMTSTPVINPIAVILSYGLLGRDITIIYVIIGFILPFIIGITANTFAGPELHFDTGGMQLPQEEYTDSRTLLEKFKDGINWVINDFGLTISKYVISGMLMAGFILVTFPSSIIQKYLGNPSALSLLNIAILAAVMYVCAVGHIPFIAAMIASGASPGSAVTFLIAGASTNIAELISIYKMIGKRAAFLYGGVVTALSLVFGYITNLILMPAFKPSISISSIDYSIDYANKLMVIFPEWSKYVASAIIFIFFLAAMYQKVGAFIDERRSA